MKHQAREGTADYRGSEKIGTTDCQEAPLLVDFKCQHFLCSPKPRECHLRCAVQETWRDACGSSCDWSHVLDVLMMYIHDVVSKCIYMLWCYDSSQGLKEQTWGANFSLLGFWVVASIWETFAGSSWMSVPRQPEQTRLAMNGCSHPPHGRF